MKSYTYKEQYPTFKSDGTYTLNEKIHQINIQDKVTKIGVMLVGMGGNNGSTLIAALIAHNHKISWCNKTGEHMVNFLGSISQFGSVHLGYDNKNNSQTQLFKEIGEFLTPENLVVGGWDICKDNLYEAAKKAQVLDYDLINKLKDKLQQIHPLPSIYNPDFIATNQQDRVNNIINNLDVPLQDLLDQLIKDISNFKLQNNLNKVIIIWTASTERCHKGTWKNKIDLELGLNNNDKEISPSILFAMAAAHSKSIFINGAPQNTLCPAVVDYARHFGTFVGGEDFKTGQTKLKSVLLDWLVAGGIKPLSLISYNHLGNNDGKNLDEGDQFNSKKITKTNVINDVVAENPLIFPNGNPNHEVVIKYLPAVGDSKRAIDEYYSELALDGRHTLVIYNICEDSLLAMPLMLDIIIFSDFFSRIIITNEQGQNHYFNTELSLLSIFFKAPVVNHKEPLINTFFRQRNGLENFFRILLGLPVTDCINLDKRITIDPN